MPALYGFVGRSGKARDPRRAAWNGEGRRTARLYRFTDYDGRRPDGAGWRPTGRGLPSRMVEWFRTGIDLQLAGHRARQPHTAVPPQAADGVADPVPANRGGPCHCGCRGVSRLRPRRGAALELTLVFVGIERSQRLGDQSIGAQPPPFVAADSHPSSRAARTGSWCPPASIDIPRARHRRRRGPPAPADRERPS